MSWTKRVEHPSEIVQKGEEVEVMVLDVDAENKRISLGLKQLQDDPWPRISERLAPGVEMQGKVARVQDKGVVVDLGDDIEGFVPVSHTGVDDAARLEEYYGSGDPVDLKVLESDAANRRIVLEVTSKPERKPGRARPEESAEAAEAGTATTATVEAAAETAAAPEARAETAAAADAPAETAAASEAPEEAGVADPGSEEEKK